MAGNAREVTQRMFEIAEERGWWGADWVDAWWQDDARLLATLHLLVDPADGASVRIDATPAGGALWVGIEPMRGELRHFAVSATDAAGGAAILRNAQHSATVRAQEPDKWLTWYGAMYQLRRERKPPQEPIRVGQWLGGRTGAGSLIAQARKVSDDGQVMQVVFGGRIIDVPAGATWFAWRSEARRMAAEEIGRGPDTGGIYYPHYLNMRTAVLHVARRLIRTGKAQNDPDQPLKTEWKRGRQPGAAAKPRRKKTENAPPGQRDKL